jgi:hypothetical protein
MLLDALNRHRGKGQQKITVEHVHVHSGGQAVVGVVEAPGGRVQSKSKGQAHAREIMYAHPGEIAYSPRAGRYRPHARGWTGPGVGHHSPGKAFPACAGMNRL